MARLGISINFVNNNDSYVLMNDDRIQVFLIEIAVCCKYKRKVNICRLN